MKLPKHPFVRKLILLPFLAVAGLLVGEVYQRFTQKTPEEILTALGAQQVMTQTMNVNGKNVLADVWRLPEYASAAALRKNHAKIITVDKVVYVFHDDFTSVRGECTYPADLPPWEITCNYVIDAAHSRFVNGTSPLPAEQLLQAFAAAAHAAGWTPLNANLWQKEDQTLFVHATDEAQATHAVLAIQKVFQ